MSAASPLAAASAGEVPAEAESAAAADSSAIEILVRPLERRDLREVRRIDRLVYPRPWSMALYLDELARRGERIYRVACLPGPKGRPAGVVGYGGVMIVAGEGHITSVAVHPECQGRRIGARLMLALHREARRIDGLKALTLEVRASNTAAQRLYRWFGYAPVGTRKNYYRDGLTGREDALVMWCHDIDGSVHGERLDDIAAALGCTEVAPGRTHSIDEGGRGADFGASEMERVS